MFSKQNIKLMEEQINIQLRAFVSKNKDDRKMTPER